MQISKSQTQIEKQHSRSDLFEEICKRLKLNGIDLDKVKRSDISGLDELHVRGAEVSNELVREIYLKNTKVLDIGCGLGGSARMLADNFYCKVTGIDLCQEYIRTAKKLSELVGLADNTEFIKADALNLPFKDGSFDIVWTQHVQMNIENKTKLYSEIKRVLVNDGALIYYDIFKKDKQDLNYPLPCANNPFVSFLESIEVMDSILNHLGFVKLQTSDQTNKAKQFLINSIERIKIDSKPILGLKVLMGKSIKKKLYNLLKGIEENRIELQSGIYRIKSDFDINN
jgi:ubiquinone/menaquinone biosynthesis C-methylase UbiE